MWTLTDKPWSYIVKVLGVSIKEHKNLLIMYNWYPTEFKFADLCIHSIRCSVSDSKYRVTMWALWIPALSPINIESGIVDARKEWIYWVRILSLYCNTIILSQRKMWRWTQSVKPKTVKTFKTLHLHSGILRMLPTWYKIFKGCVNQ